MITHRTILALQKVAADLRSDNGVVAPSFWDSFKYVNGPATFNKHEWKPEFGLIPRGGGYGMTLDIFKNKNEAAAKDRASAAQAKLNERRRQQQGKLQNPDNAPRQ